MFQVIFTIYPTSAPFGRIFFFAWDPEMHQQSSNDNILLKILQTTPPPPPGGQGPQGWAMAQGPLVAGHAHERLGNTEVAIKFHEARPRGPLTPPLLHSGKGAQTATWGCGRAFVTCVTSVVFAPGGKDV